VHGSGFKEKTMTTPTVKSQVMRIEKTMARGGYRMPCALSFAPYAACHAIAFGRTQRRMQQSFRTGGFTLLEILIAITIFAVLVTTIFGSFNTVFGNIGAIETYMDTYDMAQSCFKRMVTDLQSMHIAQPPAFAPSRDDAGPDPYRIVGDTTYLDNTDYGRLRFASLAHVPLGKQKRSGIAEIIYYVEPETDGSLVLRRSDRLDPTEAAPETSIKDPILCEKIRALSFAFIDADGEARETWDSDSEDFDYETPQAVRIRMEIGSEDMTHLFETTVMLPQVRKDVTAESWQSL
jgi:general secretion pathway protein J